MVQPFDYSMGVPDPMGMMVQGFGLGQQQRANEMAMQQSAVQEQRDATLFDQAQQDRQAKLAEAEAQRQGAVALQQSMVALGQKVAAGTATANDFAQLSLAHPDMADQLKTVWDGVSKERKANDAAGLFKAATAIKSGRPDIAEKLLDDYATAAENSGQKMDADLARGVLGIIRANPSAGLTQLGILLHSVDPDAAEKVFGAGDAKTATAGAPDGTMWVDPADPSKGVSPIPGIAPSGPEWRQATPEEAAKYGATAGQINTKTGKFEAERPANGMSLTVNPDGSTSFVQGPGVTDKQAAQANQNAVTSDVVLNAAAKARDLIGVTTTGILGAGASYNPQGDAAELYRQVDVLKANAKAANLNAMRQASPTGGALGNVSNSDIQMLADKSGALDPKAGPERFRAQLDDYERTLLRVIHGVEAGDRIFNEMRAAPVPGQGSQSQDQPPPQVGDWMKTWGGASK